MHCKRISRVLVYIYHRAGSIDADEIRHTFGKNLFPKYCSKQHKMTMTNI